jgi:hypothetical protein
MLAKLPILQIRWWKECGEGGIRVGGRNKALKEIRIRTVPKTFSSY